MCELAGENHIEMFVLKIGSRQLVRPVLLQVASPCFHLISFLYTDLLVSLQAPGTWSHPMMSTLTRKKGLSLLIFCVCCFPHVPCIICAAGSGSFSCLFNAGFKDEKSCDTFVGNLKQIFLLGLVTDGQMELYCGLCMHR